MVTIDADADYIKAEYDLAEHVAKTCGVSGHNKRYWCPWCQVGGSGAGHNSPALQVDDLWHCFGCGRGGDIITWEMELYDVDFIEACKRLTGGRFVEPVKRSETILKKAAQMEEDLERKIQDAQKVLAELREERRWLEYYRNLEQHPEGRQAWHERGLTDDYLAYWQFGYDPMHKFFVRGHGDWYTPTLSIPYLDQSGECADLKHRLINVPDTGGKYRHEKSGLPKSLWVANYDEPLSGFTVVCEGEIKAAVTFACIDNPKIQVVGLPSKSAYKVYTERLEGCDPVYIALDPDATEQAEEMAKILGSKRCRILDLPDKIDDLIVAGALDKDGLRNWIRSARRV